MRVGVRLGVDVGKARIGVARSDRDGVFASAVETVQRAPEGSDDDLARLVEIAEDCDAIEWVVGLPVSLAGTDTASTSDARAFALRLAERSHRPVRLVDERLSTVSAQAQLQASGKRTRSHRAVIDQVAAVILLQTSLDAERNGRILGEVVPGANEGTDQ